MKRFFASILVLTMVLSLMVGCGKKEGGKESSGDNTVTDNPYTPENPLIWKLNSNQNEEETKNSAQGQAYLHLAETVKEKTNGAWQIEMYYSSQLGSKTAELINGAQFGTFQLFNLNCSSWGEYSNAFSILNIPYLFTDEEVAIEFMRGEMGKKMSEKLSEDTGISIAFYCPAGFRNTYNNVRPIHKPEDMVGIKMRTMSDKYIIAAFEALGASAVSVPYSELYTALSQSLVDGADNPFLNIYNSKHNEVATYLSETRNVFSVANLCVADVAYDALPDEWKQLFDETCVECLDIGCNTAIDKSAIEAREFLVANMKFNTLTDEEYDAFREATSSVWDMAKSDLGEEYWNQVMQEIDRIEKELDK